MIIKLDDHISFEIRFDPFDREDGYDDDIRFAVEETPPSPEFRMLAANEISMLLTPDQAENMAVALWQAAQESRNTPRPGKRAKKQAMQSLLALAYPNIAHWIEEMGWIELGKDEYSKSLVRVLDEGGMVWESSKQHKTLTDALDAAEAAIEAWDKDQG
ncbi:MAG: hypothetical protein JXA78_09105 [Anaerolineales bacterium]|nr:hypothetical protein [Anaerolineales bacterium]